MINVSTEEQYKNYIAEHVGNVKLANEQYGKALCIILGVNPKDVNDLVAKHDQSKFLDGEFDSYRQFFYPEDGEEKNKQLFDLGWLFHQNRNPHHPEFWILRDGHNIRIMDMPKKYIVEMLLDWAAMGYKFKDTAYNYYQKEGSKKPFSDNTRKLVESVIDILK